MVGRSAFRVADRISKFANSNAGAKAQIETMRACDVYFARRVCILTFAATAPLALYATLFVHLHTRATLSQHKYVYMCGGEIIAWISAALKV